MERERAAAAAGELSILFFFILVTGPRRSLSLKLSATRVYAPQIRGPLDYLTTTSCITCFAPASFHHGECLHTEKAHRLLHHSTLGLRVIKKKKNPALPRFPVRRWLLLFLFHLGCPPSYHLTWCVCGTKPLPLAPEGKGMFSPNRRHTTD